MRAGIGACIRTKHIDSGASHRHALAYPLLIKSPVFNVSGLWLLVFCDFQAHPRLPNIPGGV